MKEVFEVDRPAPVRLRFIAQDEGLQNSPRPAGNFIRPGRDTNGGGSNGSGHMTDEQQLPTEVQEQQAIVRRYASELSQAAGGTRRRPAEPSVRRCYELLNECAMELAEFTRTRTPSNASPAAH